MVAKNRALEHPVYLHCVIGVRFTTRFNCFSLLKLFSVNITKVSVNVYRLVGIKLVRFFNDILFSRTSSNGLIRRLESELTFLCISFIRILSINQDNS